MFIDCLKDYPKNIANFFSENNPTMNLIASTLRKNNYEEIKTRLCVWQGRTVRTCVEFFGMKKKGKIASQN